jgi:hypothetical protein
MLRSLAVIAFIGAVGAAAIYAAQRKTIARGDVIGAELLDTNREKLRALRCDPEIPIGVDGATFACRAEFKTGEVERLQFKLQRDGSIEQVDATRR